MTNTNTLHDSWLRVTGGVNHAEDFFDLVCGYSTSERHYHTLEHVRDMAAGLLEFESEYPARHNYADLHRAAWWHDSIYDSSRKDNEEQSAELAAGTLARWGANEEWIEPVRNLILATKLH